MPVEVDALIPPLRKSKDGKGSGKEGSGKSPRKPADGKTCNVWATQDTTRKTAGNDRDKPKESPMARARGSP